MECGACPRRQVFKSHCAPEAAAALGPAQLTVAELRARLQALSQPTKGLKVHSCQPTDQLYVSDADPALRPSTHQLSFLLSWSHPVHLCAVAGRIALLLVVIEGTCKGVSR